MHFSPTTAIRSAPDAVSRVVTGEAILVEMKSGRYFGLDPVGTRVWELIAEKGTVGGVVTAMVEEFDVEEERLRADVDDLLQRLLAAGLVVVEHSAG